MRVNLGETPYQMLDMQSEQRIKRQNRGNNMVLHHNLIFGSRDQMGSRLSVANGEAEDLLNYPAEIMSSGFHGWTGERNRMLINRNFISAEAGSSSSFGFPSYNGRLLRNPVPEREPLSHWRYNPSANCTDSCYTRSASRNKRKRYLHDSMESLESFGFRRTVQQGRDLPWSHYERTTSRAASVTSLLFSIRNIPGLHDHLYPRDRVALSQLPTTRLVQHLHVGSNRYQGEQPNVSQQVFQPPFIQNVGGLPDALISQPMIPRGAPANGYTMPPARNLLGIAPVQRENPSSSLVPWRGNEFVSEERSMAHLHVHRDPNAAVSVGVQANSFQNEASSGLRVPSWMWNPFELSRRAYMGFPQRDLSLPRSYQALVAPEHVSHVRSPIAPLINHDGWSAQGRLPPYHLVNTNSMNLVSLPGPGSAYPPFRSSDTSAVALVREPTEIEPPPPLHYYGMSFQGSEMHPPQRDSDEQLPSHESFDRALTYNGFENEDRHFGLQPDVDNMSYEELLALEERIGNVNTGLSEESITKCLQTSKHSSYDATASVSKDIDEKCSICQEEYTEADELGQLNCSHSYHTDCIKQWLVLKNQCPICKAAALALS